MTSVKAKCLTGIDDVFKGRTSRVVLMKHDRPVAAIVPTQGQTVDLWGSMRGTVQMMSGTDLTAATVEVWDADD